MSNLISPAELGRKHNLHRSTVAKIIEGATPAYKTSDGRGRVVLYNLDEVEPLVLAEIKRRKPVAPPPPPPPIDSKAMLDAPDGLKAQVKAVFGAVEIVRHRLEEVIKDQADIDFRTAVIFDRTTELVAANEEQAKRNEVDDSFKRSAAAAWFTNQQALKDMRLEISDWNAALNQRLDRMREDIENLDANLHQRMDAFHNRLELLANQMNTILSRLPAPLPTPTPNASDMPVIHSDREVPVTITTGPAFKEPKAKRRAVVLGVTDGQRQAIKQEVGDAWELEFFEGSQRYNGKFATALDKSEFMVVMNSFRGNGPEGLAKEAGKPCYRAAGTRGIVELLIEKL